MPCATLKRDLGYLWHPPYPIAQSLKLVMFFLILACGLWVLALPYQGGRAGNGTPKLAWVNFFIIEHQFLLT